MHDDGTEMVEYPYKSNFMDFKGIRYHYLDEGSGLPIVMVHGNPTWSFYYRHLIEALKDDYRVIVPDHVGCGLSDKPGDEQYDYTLESRIDDLQELLENLGIHDDITLVVHDWGGMIGLGYASRFPNKVKRMVIFNTSGFLKPPSKKFPWPLHLCRTPPGALLVRGFNAFSFAASYICTKKNRLSPEIRKMYRMPYNTWKNRIATLRFVQDIPLKPADKSYEIVKKVDENLSQFKDVPKLICWGLKDFVFDHHFLTEWQKRFPDAQVHRFEDCGHYILEDARNEIIILVRRFLKDNPLAKEQ